MATVSVLQHFWCEHAGIFGSTLTEEGHNVELVKLWDGDAVPAPDDFDAWLVMGGPMNVDEITQYPWLEPERALVAELVRRDRPTMGICLGAQLIARAAGAPVYAKRPKEIGLFDIAMTSAAREDPLFAVFGDPQEVLQWHGDTFDLPPRAVHLARSTRYENQAFRLGRRVYGLQFHLECTEEIASNFKQFFADELAELPPEESFDRYNGRLSASLSRQNDLARWVIQAWSAMFD